MIKQLMVQTLNVRGLNNPEKRRKLFAWLFSLSADIFLLTETNCNFTSEATEWSREWATLGQHGAGNRPISKFSSQAGGHSGGSAILVRPASAPFFNSLLFCHPNSLHGRVTRLRCEWGGDHYDISCIYAPARREHRDSFFNGLELMAPPAEGARVIWGGDFNCVLDRNRDLQNWDTYPHEGEEALRSAVQRWGLLDVWNAAPGMRSHAESFTHFSQQSNFASRLDRFYASAIVSSATNSIRVLPSGGRLDHNGVEMSVKPTKSGKRLKKWVFNSSALADELFSAQLQGILLSHLTGPGWLEDPAQHWLLAKKHVRAAAIRFGRKQGRQRAEAKRAAERAYWQANTPDARREAELVLTALADHAAEGVRVRAGMSLHGGDRPTAAFFARAKPRGNQDTIDRLTAADGSLITGQPAILDSLTNYWSGIYGAGEAPAPPDPAREAAQAASLSRIKRKVSAAQAADLQREVDMDELKAALFSLPSQSAPGEDGLTVDFYKKYWEQLGPTLLLILQRACAGESPLPPASLAARVTLISKTAASAPKAGDFRPISLLNVDIKIFSKTLARRLDAVLPTLCGPTQTGFIPGRQIISNLTFNRDVLDFAQSNKQPGVVAFLDFAKAYDLVSWDFRDAVLRKMDIPESVLTWVRILYDGATMCLAVNGERSAQFTLARPICAVFGAAWGPIGGHG